MALEAIGNEVSGLAKNPLMVRVVGSIGIVERGDAVIGRNDDSGMPPRSALWHVLFFDRN
jgi:hypothetical protein